jgi:hypothetical protein
MPLQNIIAVQPDTWITFPKAIILAGTVTSNGKQVTGVGTDFINQLFYNPQSGNTSMRYKYIVHPDTYQIRTITLVQSATELQIKTPFTGAQLSGDNFMVISDEYIRELQVSGLNTSTLSVRVPDSDSVDSSWSGEVKISDKWGIKFPVAIYCNKEMTIIQQ